MNIIQRPEGYWDRFFLKIARSWSEASKDPSTQVGAVLVSPDRAQVRSGYNGFPKRMPDVREWYENRDEKYPRMIHAEMNAIIHAKIDLECFTCYTYPSAPCDRCAAHAIDAGITRFVFPVLPESMKPRWEESVRKAKKMIDDCREKGVTWEEIAL